MRSLLCIQLFLTIAVLITEVSLKPASEDGENIAEQLIGLLKKQLAKTSADGAEEADLPPVILHPVNNERRQTVDEIASVYCNRQQTQDLRGAGEGTVQSPGHPQKYRNNRDNCILIGADGQDFELVFNSPFRIEVDVDEGCSYDYLEIYGPGGSYPIYGPLCGNEPPEPLEFSGEVMVYFHSDASVRQRGFSADYGPPGTVGYEEVVCAELTDWSGLLRSPGYDAGERYPSNYHDCWILGNDTMTVDIDIIRFRLEEDSSCRYDSLVFSSMMEDDVYHPEVQLCGSTPPGNFHFPRGPILVEFTTDDSVQKRGFKFRYTLDTIDDTVECISLPGPSGSLTLTAEEYVDNAYGCWSLASDPGQIVRIAFSRFEVEGGEGCPYDSLAISDAAGARRTLCGDVLPDPFMSNTGFLQFLFTSDGSATFGGFDLTYEIVESGGPLECDVIPLEKMEGITTPNYPNGYLPNFHECVTIQPPSGQPVYLHFTDIQMQNTFQCTADYVQIYDGTMETGSILGRFCAPDIHEVPPALSGVMTMEFFSNDDTIVGGGLAFSFTTSPDGIDNGDGVGDGNGDGNGIGEEGGSGITSNQNPACNGQPVELTGDSGTITFLDEETSTKYDNDMSCNWVVTVAEGKRVKFLFTYMDIEDHVICEYDGVSVREVNTLIGKTCGAQGHDIVSWENSVTLNFYSDGSNSGRGFTVDYSAVAYNTIELENTPPPCGIVEQQRNHMVSTRIVGGVEAMPYDWPWQISLLIAGAHNCGGSILSDYWILTAAHCTHGNMNPDSYAVVLAQHNQRVFEGFEIVYRVAEVINHENYDPGTTNNDIALLRLEMPIKWNQHTIPICLPNEDAIVDGTCYTTGWGNTEGTGDETVLNEADVPIIDTAVSNQPGWYDGALTPEMLTAGTASGGKDSCQGDSGGPLVCKRSRTAPWSQAGVTSWGYGCADANNPGVYARVKVFVDWVQGKTNGVAQTTQ